LLITFKTQNSSSKQQVRGKWRRGEIGRFGRDKDQLNKIYKVGISLFIRGLTSFVYSIDYS